MSSTQLSLTVLKISLINVGKIGCMLREKYKQTICFLAVTFFLSVFWTTCVRSVCVLSGGISGADLEPYTHLGWSILAGWWMLLCGLTIAWKVYCLFYLVFILLICYLHWHYTIQMHVKFNIMDELHVFYRSTQRRIQDTFNICVGAFLQVNECTSEVLLFLSCQNDILSISFLLW